MCDPISAVLGLAATAGSALFGGSKKAAPPPAAAIAAQPIDATAQTKPTVEVGNDDNKDDADAGGGGMFVAKRKAGTAIGGLGKSSIGLNL